MSRHEMSAISVYYIISVYVCVNICIYVSLYNVCNIRVSSFYDITICVFLQFVCFCNLTICVFLQFARFCNLSYAVHHFCVYVRQWMCINLGNKCLQFVCVLAMGWLPSVVSSLLQVYFAEYDSILQNIGLFCRIGSLLQGSFTKETCNFKEPTNRSHPIYNFCKLCLFAKI